VGCRYERRLTPRREDREDREDRKDREERKR